jgi:nucleotide-binding universal stress UspA family protein
MIIANILVPTDFGDVAARALDTAISLARAFDAKITLFHAYALPLSYGYGDLLVWPIEGLEQAARRRLDAAVAAAKARYPRVEGVLDVGVAWERALEAVRARQADLVVMGTHGRQGLERVLLGSVAEKLVRLSPVPVVAVPAAAPA